jgi:hypothetical protein
MSYVKQSPVDFRLLLKFCKFVFGSFGDVEMAVPSLSGFSTAPCHKF